MKKKEICFYNLFFIFFYLLFCINCQTPPIDCSSEFCSRDSNSNNCVDVSSGSCNQACKPNFLNSDCIYCENSNSYEYYTINDDNTCTSKSSCGPGEKIIDGSKQCISECGDKYQLGDYCYSDIPENAERKESSSNILKCQFRYHKTTEDNNKERIHCYSENIDCDYNYYDSVTLLCSNESCPNKKK